MKKALVFMILGAFVYAISYPMLSELACGIIAEYNLESNVMVQKMMAVADFFR